MTITTKMKTLVRLNPLVTMTVTVVTITIKEWCESLLKINWNIRYSRKNRKCSNHSATVVSVYNQKCIREFRRFAKTGSAAMFTKWLLANNNNSSVDTQWKPKWEIDVIYYYYYYSSLKIIYIKTIADITFLEKETKL